MSWRHDDALRQLRAAVAEAYREIQPITVRDLPWADRPTLETDTAEAVAQYDAEIARVERATDAIWEAYEALEKLELLELQAL